MRRERAEAVGVGLLLLALCAAIPTVVLLCTIRALS